MGREPRDWNPTGVDPGFGNDWWGRDPIEQAGEGTDQEPAEPAEALVEPETASGAVRGDGGTQATYTAWIHPARNRWEGAKDAYLYSIEFDGEMIVQRDREAVFAACRVLHGRGITGSLRVRDATNGRLRLTVDIEKGARWTVEENRQNGPRFVKWRPWVKS